jgi:hypothetical protein
MVQRIVLYVLNLVFLFELQSCMLLYTGVKLGLSH